MVVAPFLLCIFSAQESLARGPIWIYWKQGISNLKAAGGKYRFAFRCVQYWQRLNPHHDVRVLNHSVAADLSPSYRAAIERNQQIQLASDVLRLELLSLYGGTWTDATVCPVQPLAAFVPELLAAGGFFAWHGQGPSSETSAFPLQPFKRAQSCVPEGAAEFKGKCNIAGTFNIDTWFLTVAHPKHPLVGAWLRALNQQVAKLSNGAKAKKMYCYHFVHCIFNQLYADDPKVHNAYDRIPLRGYCDQSGGNAVDLCPRLGKHADATPDPQKLMYKGGTALAKMNFTAYDLWIHHRSTTRRPPPDPRAAAP